MTENSPRKTPRTPDSRKETETPQSDLLSFNDVFKVGKVVVPGESQQYRLVVHRKSDKVFVGELFDKRIKTESQINQIVY